MSQSQSPFNDRSISSSDDEAPEEVSVSTTRKQNINSLREFQEFEKKRNAEEKERRRQRNEKYRQQKEKKLKELKQRTLGQDVLEALAEKSKVSSDAHTQVSAPASKRRKTKAETNESSESEEEYGDDEDNDDLDKEDESNEDDAASDNDSERLADSGVDEDEDFISFSSRKSKSTRVMTLTSISKLQESAAKKALSFKNSRLYGNRKRAIPRESAKDRKAKLEKRRAGKDVKRRR